MSQGLEIQATLKKILASTTFNRCPRMSRFLRFVVEETLHGRSSELKETLIGVRVFDKPASYDPNTDSTVRVEATKLRTRLARYYEVEGRDDTVIIDIPKGGYAPRFETHDGPAAEPVAEVQTPEPVGESVLNRAVWPSVRAWRETLAWCLVAGLAITYLLTSTRAEAVRNRSTTIRFQISPPQDARVPSVSEVGPAVLSADDSSLAFVADKEGKRMLYLRKLEHVSPQRLSGTEGASFPFWSPDGKSMGYFAGGYLMRIDLDTGLVSRLAEAPQGRGGAWSSTEEILFAPSSNGPLFAVATKGGRVKQVTRLRQGEVSQQQPSFARQGSHFLFVARRKDSGYAQLFRADLASGADPVALAATDSAGHIIGDDVVHARNGQLVAQPLSLSPLMLKGPLRELARTIAIQDSVADFSMTSKMISRRSEQQNYWTIEVTP